MLSKFGESLEIQVYINLEHKMRWNLRYTTEIIYMPCETIMTLKLQIIEHREKLICRSHINSIFIV